MKLLKFGILLCIGLFFINACVNAPVKISKSPKKAPLQNAWHNFTDKDAFTSLKSNFFKKDVHIRIFGDSHMAADFFSSRLRDYIKTKSIGFVYPLQPKYHQVVPLQYESKNFELLNSKSLPQNHYPMGGIIAKSLKQGAYVRLDSTKNSNFSFGILFQSPQNKDALIITDARGQIFRLKSQNINKWTYAFLSNLEFPININALNKDVLLGGYFITNQGARLDTLGINGAKADLWLRWDRQLFLQELNLLKSDIVILAYGSNEALAGAFDESVFKANFKDFIALLYKSNPNTSIILISPPTVTYKINGEYELAQDFHRVRKALYELAKEEKLLLFDMHEAMQKSGGKAFWIEQNLSLKDVHLSPSGYKAMADEFYFSLLQMLQTTYN